MDIEEVKDRSQTWFNKIINEKKELIKFGVKTWEFYLLGLTIMAVIASPFIFPGIYATGDTTPNSKPYSTIITYEDDSQNTTYVDIDCQPDDFITTQELAYLCDFRFEKSDGSLQIYNEDYIQDATGENIFVKDWSRKTDPETRVRQGSYRSLTEEFVHETDDGGYSISGTFRVIGPRTPGIYDFSIVMGEFFGGNRGDVQTVTVFSPTETSNLETRDFLMPFQRLVVIGILLSFLKLWIEMLDRIDEKRENEV